MWGKLLKFPAHPPYKPIRSTHEQRVRDRGVKTGKDLLWQSVRGRQGSSGRVRGRRGRRGRQQILDRGRQGRQGSSAEIGQLLLPSLK